MRSESLRRDDTALFLLPFFLLLRVWIVIYTLNAIWKITCRKVHCVAAVLGNQAVMDFIKPMQHRVQ